jgi:hypothetical protein
MMRVQRSMPAQSAAYWASYINSSAPEFLDNPIREAG